MRQITAPLPSSKRRSALLVAAVSGLLALSALLPSLASGNAGYIYGGTNFGGPYHMYYRTNSTGQFKLIMQNDGNLVLYQQAGRAMWASNTGCHCFASMQKDGNLVIYEYPTPGLLPPVCPCNRWASNTAGHPGAFLAVQDDGNAVIYSSNGAPLWATNTVYSKLYHPDYMNPGMNMWSPNRVYHLVMQYDGNLVLYNHPGGRAIWASNTAGHAGAYVAMQNDGNLVVYWNSCGPYYNCTGPIWDSKTAGHSGAYLNLQSDGNLVIYQGSTAVWWTNTVGKAAIQGSPTEIQGSPTEPSTGPIGGDTSVQPDEGQAALPPSNGSTGHRVARKCKKTHKKCRH